MMKPATILHVTDSEWRFLDRDGRWNFGVPWQRLDRSAVVLLDLEAIHTDVWRFEGKTEYATALIEKRVRGEGLVDGAAHVVVHQTVSFEGGFQVLFSALPLEHWQQATQWASAQRDHCALLLPAALLTLNSHKRGGSTACALLSESNWKVLVQSPTGMALLTARVQRGQKGNDGLVSAAQLLSNTWVQWAHGVDQVDLVTLGLPEHLATDEPEAALAQVTHCVVRPTAVHRHAPSEPSQEAWCSSLPALLPKMAGRHFLGSGLARLAWQAESWVTGLTGAVALAAGGLLATAAFAQHESRSLQTQTQQLQREATEIEQRIAQLGQVEPPAGLVQAAEFAQQLQQGHAMDPLRLLVDLKRTSGPELRIQRIRLEPAADGKTKMFRVEGFAALELGHEVMRWVEQMERAGWSLRALDPQSPQPGAWAYAITPKRETRGAAPATAGSGA